MTALEAYILSRAFTKQAIAGAGALKGAPCQIQSITPITGGNRITFAWENSEGGTETDTLDVMNGVDGTNGTDGTDGTDGVGISSITFKEKDASGNNVYTVTLTNTNTYDITCPIGPQGETGATGATGNGIASITKTGTSGLVDTYTITYTNGTTSTFTVTNGQNGENEFIGTLAEWNALTSAQQKEYDTYQITDDYTEGKYIYLPTIYSEEEREVGVWKDGKPLYQKTIDFGALPNNTSKSVASGLTGVSVKSIFGTAMASNGFTVTLPHAELSGTGSIDVSYLADNNVRISTDYDYSAYSSCITLQYTKTTDTAGSGTWTPTGEYAEHYSTTPEVIGTWIDGKTIKRVVYEFETAKVIANNAWTGTGISLSCEGFVRAQGLSSSNEVFALNASIDNGELKCMVNAYTGITLKRLIIEYIESTS